MNNALQTKHVQDSPSSLARVQDDRFHDSCTGAKLVLHACKTKACKSPDSGPSNAGAGKSVQAGLQRLAERARACKSVQERARATFTSKTPVTRHISCAHATCAPQSSVLLISRGRVVVYGDVDDAAARVDPKSDAPALHVARRGAVQTEALLAVHARRPALVGRRAPRLVRVGSPVTGKFITRWFARSC